MTQSQVFTEYDKTGVYAVDLVAACVSHYRKQNVPLKTIWLRADLYYKFELWVSKNMPEANFLELRLRGFDFDGIPIRKGSDFQSKEIVWDKWALDLSAQAAQVADVKQSGLHKVV